MPDWWYLAWPPDGCWTWFYQESVVRFLKSVRFATGLWCYQLLRVVISDSLFFCTKIFRAIVLDMFTQFQLLFWRFLAFFTPSLNRRPYQSFHHILRDEFSCQIDGTLHGLLTVAELDSAKSLWYVFSKVCVLQVVCVFINCCASWLAILFFSHKIILGYLVKHVHTISVAFLTFFGIF